ncbi:hypothetical protein ACL6C3_20970 [Capilliphycus salinus ALCB114379]|uniref:hypothetical protein n=1 Tax=Capilliphycus salinus TaxID=2768948 RepID=UPI0039A53B49
MTDPVFWLGLSILLVAASLSAVLIAALPALQALARAARSLEKLADTLSREFPPTLEAIRMTGLEISELTDDVSEGVQSAGQVVKQVDRSIDNAKKQAQKVQSTTGSIFTGFKVAWNTFRRLDRRQVDQLPPPANPVSEIENHSNSDLESSYNYPNPEDFYQESGREPQTPPYPQPEYKTLNSNRRES